MLYPAFVEVDKDGSASGWFPDVPGCIFAGGSIQEAFLDAGSAIDAHFELLSEKDMPIPSARKIEEHVAVDVATYMDGQWLYIDVNMDKFDGRAERINITLPHRLLERIDATVKTTEGYSSRSAFLAAAARNELLKSA
ncbi:TPA: type II toxin-antitoxin system HicB family antitoxin [Klebsiella variicola subsp. variicola]|nr:type II toxin-antitoxin system HicB family antitoxin [Klebsiella variicola subsp. variicola]